MNEVTPLSSAIAFVNFIYEPPEGNTSCGLVLLILGEGDEVTLLDGAVPGSIGRDRRRGNS